MSLLHSPPLPSNQDLPELCSACFICSEDMTEPQEILIIATCNHEFHRNCIETYLSKTSECPYCKKCCELADLTIRRTESQVPRNSPVQQAPKQNIQTRGKARGAMAKKYNTRNASKNLNQEFRQTPLVEFSTVNPCFDTENFSVNSPLRNVPPSYMVPNQTQIPQNLTYTQNRPDVHSNINVHQLNQMIESTLSRFLRNLNIGPNSYQPCSQNIPNNFQFHQPYQSYAIPTNSATIQRNGEEPFAMRAEKITSIIQNWNLKFDGSANGLNVEEFLYRVRSLTTENFNGDFNIICKNLHMLLVGKAREWYWRYHKQVENIDWNQFCAALRYQYKDFRSNFDIKEEIRNRKMKPGEKFEIFYESICTMLDRLENPIPETELVEILTRNLRSDIRHELLYVPIYSIAHLRKLVQMRENLLGDDYFRKTAPVKPPQCYSRRAVAELDAPETITVESTVDAIRSSAIVTNCWNCGEAGHHWEDCLKERKIFCYGCGEKNTYKPQCVRCANRKMSAKN